MFILSQIVITNGNFLHSFHDLAPNKPVKPLQATCTFFVVTIQVAIKYIFDDFMTLHDTIAVRSVLSSRLHIIVDYCVQYAPSARGDFNAKGFMQDNKNAQF